jgi:peroxiredoxin Q/BCP
MAWQRYGKNVLFILFLNSLLITACTSNNKDMKEKHDLKIGDKAPLFSLVDQNGKVFDLASHIGSKTLVVFFYPKDESYGCTKEACSFRDQYEVFREAGSEVIGISADDEASHSSFASSHRLPFTLLSDPDRKVAELYGVGKTLGLIAGRVTYVIDRQGIIRGKFSSQLNYTGHIEEALKVIRSF